MNRLRWQFSIIKYQLGWFGLVGLVGFAYVAIYFYTTVVPSEKLLSNTQQALTIASTNQAAAPSVIVDSPIGQLENLINNFPDAESINPTWEQLAQLAEKSGLTIYHARYELSPQEHGGLLRYQHNMPITATYPQIRDFLAVVIETIPNVALEQLSFKRESVDSPLVSANIDFAIYVRVK